MAEIRLYKSLWKALKLIVLSLPFALFILHEIFKNQSSKGGWLDWFGLCFFGSGILIGLFNLFDRRPQLIINEVGILHPKVYKEYVTWDLIEDAYPKVFKRDYRGIPLTSQKFICIVIKENSIGKLKVNKLTKLFGVQPYSIMLDDLSRIDLEKLTTLIKRMALSIDSERKKILFDYNVSL